MSSLPDESFPEIRESVRKLCAQFPGSYWQALDRDRTYPTQFVRALTEAGFLSVLIPEAYGGSGLGLGAAIAILEEVHRSGCNGGACHAQMYTMGTLLKHGSEAQKADYLPRIATGELRLQAFGVTEPGAGTDTTRITTTARRDGDAYVVNGQKLWISRAEHSDLMILLVRTTPRDQVTKASDGMSVLLVDLREAVGQGLTIRPVRTMLNHATTELFFENLRVPARNLIGQEGQGFRYILDGMNAERILIASECIGDGKFFVDRASAYARDREVFGRPIGQNQGVQFPIARAHVQIAAAELMVQRRGPVRRRPAVRGRGQYGQAPGLGGVMGGGGYLPADPRRLRVRRGVRHRAKVPRDPALSGGPDLDEPDPQPRGHPRAGHAQVLLGRVSAGGLARLAVKKNPFRLRQAAPLRNRACGMARDHSNVR